ncbi:MAG TPA: hypothetical protein VNX28_19635, partial [Gemmataceae bacterium]|nr:hypothetical protein [Gemmataceae bacterium]
MSKIRELFADPAFQKAIQKPVAAPAQPGPAKDTAASSGPPTSEPRPENASLAGPQGDLVKGLNPIPTPNPVSCTVLVKNNTKQPLQLDSRSLNTSGKDGQFQRKPPPTIKEGETATFKAVNDKLLLNSPQGVDLTVTYFLDDQKQTTWALHFDT